MVSENLSDYYEKVAVESDVLYSGTGFMNYGFWNKNINTPAEASKNLVHHLANFFNDYQGLILNAACGNGSDTKILTQYFNPTNITSINISKPQLERAARKTPEAKFIQMSATDLKFENNYFNNIICIEAAFHFNTREKFLSESFRVLNHGGKIVIADILFKSNFFLNKTFFSDENKLKHPKDYTSLLKKCGFTNIDLVDVTNSTLKPFVSYIISNLFKRYPIGVIKFLLPRIINISSYVFIIAERP
ncbi:MAG: class I SAM-dependent methyltransferase [Candidatus Rickettsiella isopodorum]